ncbi:hypothetical protein HanRHA438_Chr12g0534401 [Helianthus annuus]|nr:hypothetical protein HanRHA438_Chr12g0534401 [Helianthus annuus]
MYSSHTLPTHITRSEWNLNGIRETSPAATNHRRLLKHRQPFRRRTTPTFETVTA